MDFGDWLAYMFLVTRDYSAQIFDDLDRILNLTADS